MVKIKNPICEICKKDIELAELTMLEQADALDGLYKHPECEAGIPIINKESKIPETTKFRHI